MSDPLLQIEGVNKVWVKTEIKEEPVDIEETFYDKYEITIKEESYSSDEADNYATQDEGQSYNELKCIQNETSESNNSLLKESKSIKSKKKTSPPPKKTSTKVRKPSTRIEKPSTQIKKPSTQIKKPLTELKCLECDYKTLYRHALKSHVFGKHRDITYTCDICGHTSKYSTSIARHKKMQHKDLNTDPKLQPIEYTCKLCPYKTVYKNNMGKHEAHKHSSFTCTLCAFSTNKKDVFLEHVSDHHNSIQVECKPEELVEAILGEDKDDIKEGVLDLRKVKSQKNDQDKKQDGDKDIKSEVQNKKKRIRPRPTEKKFSCEFCDYKTCYKNALKMHRMTHTNDKPIKCDQCEYQTKYTASMYRHKLIIHKTEDPTLNVREHCCKLCDYKTFYNGNLKAHMRKHSAIKQYKCAHCEYETAYRNCYDKHSKTHNKVELNKMFECSICSFNTKTEGRLSWHLFKIHKKPMHNGHKCEFCDFTTKVKWRLNIHVQRSKLQTPLKCLHCDYSSKFKCQVKQHKASHFSGIEATREAIDFVTEKINECGNDNSKVPLELVNVHMDLDNGEMENEDTDMDVSDSETDKDYTENSSSDRENMKGNLNKNETTDKESGDKLTVRENLVEDCETMHDDSENHENVLPMNLVQTVMDTVKPEVHTENPKTGNKSSQMLNNKLVDSVNHSVDLLMSKDHQLGSQIANMIMQNAESQTPHLASEISQNISNNPQESSALAMTFVQTVMESLKAQQNNCTEYPETDEANCRLDYKTGIMEYNNAEYILQDEQYIEWKSIHVIERKDEEKPYKCEQCEYSSRFKASVQRHFQRHHGNQSKPYKCARCEFATSTRDSIALHNKRSKVQIPIMCDVCNFKCFYKCSFIAHRKLHYPFRCFKCSFACKLKCDLERHLLFHIGIGYQCKYCDYKSSTRNYLQRHEATHFTDKPYKCKLCSYSSVRQCLLESHLKRMHLKKGEKKEVVEQLCK